MTSDSSMLTKTERNLWNAIVAEALANLKYNAYAHKALEEGLPEVAQVFQEVAGAETIHGMNHLRVAGDIGNTIENLRVVTTGEAKEFSTVYPRMIREAIDEGQEDAAQQEGGPKPRFGGENRQLSPVEFAESAIGWWIGYGKCAEPWDLLKPYPFLDGIERSGLVVENRFPHK